MRSYPCDSTFWDIAALDPCRVAVKTPTGPDYTYGPLSRGCNQISHGLRAIGLQRGDCLLTAVGNSVTFLELLFAAMQTGIYLVPAKPQLTAHEFTYLLRDSQAQAVVAGTLSYENVLAATERVGLTERYRFAATDGPGFRSLAALKRGQPTSAPKDRSAGDLMLYTSGTTGKRKGVRRSLPDGEPQGAALDPAISPAVQVSQGCAGAHLNCLPLCHRGSILTTTGAIHLGRPVVLTTNTKPEHLLGLIDRFAVESVLMSPDVIQRLLALPQSVRRQYDLTSLRVVFHGSGPLPRAAKEALMAWVGPIVWGAYSSTEGVVAFCSPKEWLARPGTVGRAPRGTHIMVMDKERRQCKPGVVGEVFARIPHERPFEYFNDEPKTLASRHGSYFTVGDVGYLDGDGWLFLCGRSLDIINVGGSNVYSAEVEEVLHQHPAVSAAAVIGVPSEALGEEVLAIVELVELARPGDVLGELKDACREYLADFKRPKSVELRAELPRSGPGKIAKQVLREEYWTKATGAALSGL